MLKLRVVLGALLGVLIGCSEVPPTQLVIKVAGSPAVAAKLKYVRAFLYPAAATDESKWTEDVQFVPVALPVDGDPGMVLLGSFGVAKGPADRFKLVVKGYESSGPGAPELVEQKAIVSFQAKQKLTIVISLIDACYRPTSLCTGLDKTCATTASAGATAGTCIPVPETMGVVDSDGRGATSDGGIVSDGGILTEPGTSDTQPLYVVATRNDGGGSGRAKVQVATTSAIDVDQKLNLSGAYEAIGSNEIEAIGGKVYIVSDSLLVKRLAPTTSGALAEDGELRFPSAEPTVAFVAKMVSPTKAYLITDGSWVAWNPSSMQVGKTISFPPSIGERGGWRPNYVRPRAEGVVVRGNRLFHAVTWGSADGFQTAASSAIVVIDIDSDTVLRVFDVPCPYTAVATMDDAQNVYFSSAPFVAQAYGLYTSTPRSCAIKIPVGSEAFDPSWTLQMRQITGGKDASSLSYLGNDKLLLKMFTVRSFVPDFPTIQDWAGADDWQYATYDLVSKKFEVLSQLGWTPRGLNSTRLDGRFFLHQADENEVSWTNLELLPSGTVKKGIRVDGTSVAIFRIR